MANLPLACAFALACFFVLRAVALLVLGAIERSRSHNSASWSSRTKKSHSSSAPLRTLVILGSGGHTAEMMAIMDGMDRTAYKPMTFVRAATDTTSAARVQRKEAEKGNHDCAHLQIPRSREVGQSYVSSVWTTLVALLYSVNVVLQTRPQVVLCNGPGTGVPICAVAFLCKVFLFRPCRIVFVESFCRVQTLSMSGHMLYAFVDEFVVQWPQLDKQQPREAGDGGAKGWPAVKYIGRLC